MKTLEVKRKCCDSSPRCRRCPKVWKRLSKAGLATRVDGRNYRPSAELGARELKAARHGRL